jgi:hypothetical protein
MQSPESVLESSAFQFRPTTPTDIHAIESIAARFTRRAPTGLLSAMDDPNQRLITVTAPDTAVVGFFRFKLGSNRIQKTDVVFDPTYLDGELAEQLQKRARELVQSAPQS